MVEYKDGTRRKKQENYVNEINDENERQQISTETPMAACLSAIQSK